MFEFISTTDPLQNLCWSLEQISVEKGKRPTSKSFFTVFYNFIELEGLSLANALVFDMFRAIKSTDCVQIL
jgi:hypothetical protein